MNRRARLPVNVFASARQGDWTYLEGQMRDPGSGELRAAAERIVVTNASDDRVRVSLLTRFHGEVEEELLLGLQIDRAVGPDLNLFDCSTDGLQSGSTEPGSHRLGSEAVDCVEACWTLGHTRPDGSPEAVTLAAWLADRVLGSGIIAFSLTDSRGLIWSMGTVGYGRAGEVSWGIGPPAAG